MNHEHKKKVIPLYHDGIGSVSLVESYGSDRSVVNAARVSFGVQKDELDEKDRKLISYLIRHKHTSPFEHCGVTFKFVVPLFVRSQHHRHRTWSYNEISRRYTDRDIKFYEPSSFRTQHKTNRQASNADALINPLVFTSEVLVGSLLPFEPNAQNAIQQHHKRSLTLFDTLLKAGVCREQARGVLPQNLYTEYYGTANLSNIIKFIDLRSPDGAQWEIQQVALACQQILTDLFPETMETFNRIKDNER